MSENRKRVEKPFGFFHSLNPVLNKKLSSGFKTLVELIYASAGINEFLLTGEERMALGANFNSEITLGRFGINNFAACTSNGCIDVVGMQTFFHCLHLTFHIIADCSAYDYITVLFNLQYLFKSFFQYLRIFLYFITNFFPKFQ